VKEVVSGYPGIARGVTEYSTDRIASVIAGTGSDLTVRVYGQDFATLTKKAAEIAAGLQAVSAVNGTEIEQIDIEPTVEVIVDLTRAEKAGVKPGDVRRAAATYIQGIEVGSVFVDQQVFEVVVVGVPEIRANLSDMQNLLIETPRSGLVKLADLATVQIAANPSTIKHEAVARSIDVRLNVDGDVSDALGEINAVIANVDFPLEHHAVVLGDHADRSDSRTRFILVVIGIALAIFLLFQSAFSSWSMALALFIAMPTALAGGAVAALLDGGTVTIGSVVGFIAVLAIAIRFTMVIVRTYQHPDPDHISEVPAPSSREQVISGARRRLVPIATTVVVVILVLLPILIGGSRAGSEILHPMAVVMVGGLLTAAAFALYVVPALYLQCSPIARTATDTGRRRKALLAQTTNNVDVQEELS
jgi:Cu/Ag efflux pump CusA